jgi:hypothetical protein
LILFWEFAGDLQDCYAGNVVHQYILKTLQNTSVVCQCNCTEGKLTNIFAPQYPFDFLLTALAYKQKKNTENKMQVLQSISKFIKQKVMKGRKHLHSKALHNTRHSQNGNIECRSTHLHINHIIKHKVKLNAVIKLADKQVPAISSCNMITL